MGVRGKPPDHLIADFLPDGGRSASVRTRLLRADPSRHRQVVERTQAQAPWRLLCRRCLRRELARDSATCSGIVLTI